MVVCWRSVAILSGLLGFVSSQGQVISGSDIIDPTNNSSVASNQTIFAHSNDSHIPLVSETNPWSTNGTISEVFYINLRDRVIRNEFQFEQLTRTGIPFHRREGVTVSTLAEALSVPQYHSILHDMDSFQMAGISWDNPTALLPRKTKFVLSVYLAHVSLYEDILKNYEDDPERIVLVLEDDVALAEDLLPRFAELYKYVPQDWEVLRLGQWGKARDGDKVNEFVHRATQPFWVDETGDMYYGGAHAVCVRIKTLSTFLDKLKRIPLTDIDGMMTHWPAIKSYVLNQDLALVWIMSDLEWEKANPTQFKPDEDHYSGR